MKIQPESENLFPTVDEGLRMAFFDYGQLEKINQPTFIGLILPFQLAWVIGLLSQKTKEIWIVV
jgi:hypothetical protein